MPGTGAEPSISTVALGRRRNRTERRSVQPTMQRTVLSLLALAALALAACGSDDGGPPADDPGESTRPPADSDLDGTEYLSTAMEGHELVDGTTISLSFDDGSLSANAGCNTMFGGYSVRDGVLLVETLAQTEMGCEPALMDQDRWIAELFSSGPAIAVDGDTLTLTADDGTVLTMLDREIADPDRPVEGTRWIVTGLVSSQAISSVPIDPSTGEPVVASITIDDGRVALAAGCNTGGGSVEVGTSTLTFDAIALTRMMCPPEQMEVEDAVTTTLQGEVSYEVEADRLSLRRSLDDGTEVGLDLTAA